MRNSLLKAAAVTLAAILCLGCGQESMRGLSRRVMKLAVVQLEAMDARLGPEALPRSFQDGECIDTDMRWWASGFFPGSLWYVYEATGNEDIKALAEKNTQKLAKLCGTATDHDLGFQMNCSYGNAYRLTGNPDYLPILEESANKLAARFNPTVGCIKSWNDNRYRFPVIIDNMMNLEHLLNCAQLLGRDSYITVACTHANTTIKNHFRPDYSTYHLVDYNPRTGEVVRKQTVQGFADESAWSRGNAWGLYGFTMMYERTRIEKYLDQAQRIAAFLIPLLPEDGIPYWDFNAPGTPGALPADAPGHPADFAWKEGDPVLRDASAGAIMASALVTLASLTEDAELAKEYRNTAELQIRTLASEQYLAPAGENGNFLLMHSVGNIPAGSEIDVPLTYADYYFLEAIVKFGKTR